MAQFQPRFIRVTKDNAKQDRGIIAIDAICSVFENQEAKTVSIMTMDGFWYDVVDSLDSLYAKIFGTDEVQQSNPKKDYFRRKKMMTPSTANERILPHNEYAKTSLSASKEASKDNQEEEFDVFRSTFKKPNGGKTRVVLNGTKNLPSSEGEGHCSPNSDAGSPQNKRLPVEGL